MLRTSFLPIFAILFLVGVIRCFSMPSSRSTETTSVFDFRKSWADANAVTFRNFAGGHFEFR
jgi:hypothetical protein